MGKRVLLVGLGVRGLQWADEVRKEGWEAVAASDPSDAAQAAASARGVAAFATCSEALDSVDCDVVIVASAADRHAAPALEAIEAGKAVLIEKPMATTLTDARTIVAAAASSSMPVMVAQNYRYMRAHRTVKKVVADGTIGRIGYVHAHYYRPPHEMAPSLAGSEHSVLWGVAVHHLDAIRYVLGVDAEAVMAHEYTLDWTDLPHGASLDAVIEFEEGIRMNYSATYESRGHRYFGDGQEFYERITGDRATLHIFNRWLFLCEGRKLPRPIRRGKREITEERVLLRQLERAIETGEEPECSARDNLGTVILLEAIVRSAVEGRWIHPKEVIGD